ncbi:hypothetical protein B0H10DRAFT_1287729, partial [Mycena sp. CBHHK59/15]
RSCCKLLCFPGLGDQFGDPHTRLPALRAAHASLQRRCHLYPPARCPRDCFFALRLGPWLGLGPTGAQIGTAGGRASKQWRTGSSNTWLIVHRCVVTFVITLILTCSLPVSYAGVPSEPRCTFLGLISVHGWTWCSTFPLTDAKYARHRCCSPWDTSYARNPNVSYARWNVRAGRSNCWFTSSISYAGQNFEYECRFDFK